MITFSKTDLKEALELAIHAIEPDPTIPDEVLGAAKSAAMGLLSTVSGNGASISLNVNVAPPLNAAQISIQITGKIV